jgi:serine/threonine protein kinase
MDWAATKKPLESLYTLQRDKVLGVGSFGSVFLATDKATGEKVALKQIPKRHTNSVSFQQEMRTMMYIKSKGGHPHLCQLHEHFDTKTDYFVILDYIGGGEMFDHLIDNGAYSEMDASRLVREVASSLNFLHGIGVVHADLKPENLLLVRR